MLSVNVDGPPYSLIVKIVEGIPKQVNNAFTDRDVPLVFKIYGKLLTILLHISLVFSSSSI